MMQYKKVSILGLLGTFCLTSLHILSIWSFFLAACLQNSDIMAVAAALVDPLQQPHQNILYKKLVAIPPQSHFVYSSQDRVWLLRFTQNKELLDKELPSHFLTCTVYEVTKDTLQRENMTSWRQWLEKGSLSYLSLSRYNFHPSQGLLYPPPHEDQKSDSSSQLNTKTFLFHLFSALFSQPVEVVACKDRRKIGVVPRAGEIDVRKVWNPPLIIDGVPNSVPIQCDVYRLMWPQDGSILQNKECLMYYLVPSQEETDTIVSSVATCMPIWIESKGRTLFVIRCVDIFFIKE